ncbi:MAG: hypothetical protein J6586_10130 [Snodgrassella sp.]|nr:hypothetical protein [Snodgrassella sp.]
MVQKDTKKKKKKKFSIAQIRELEIAEDLELAKKQQAEYDVEYLEEVSRPITKKPMTKAQERNWMMQFLRKKGYKNLHKQRYPEIKALWDKVQEDIRREI